MTPPEDMSVEALVERAKAGMAAGRAFQDGGSPRAVDELARRVEEQRESMQAADDLLAGMWSYEESGRTQMGHTWPVMASDVLRAALTPADPKEEA